MKSLRTEMTNKHKSARTAGARSKAGGAGGNNGGSSGGAPADSGTDEKCTVLDYKFSMSEQMRTIQDWNSGSPAWFDFKVPLVVVIPRQRAGGRAPNSDRTRTPTPPRTL